jgi:protein-S-isoprenylcysteine O-methyltransferase Ste14/ribosomal protein S18 acetylase RimI-like enzyme
MIAIRQIREEDAPAFREVLDAVCRERRYLAMLEAPPAERVQSFLASNVRSGHPQLVAEEDGKIVGWCDAIPGPAESGTAHIGRLGMGVLIGYRGRGIGRMLAEAAIGRARQLGLEKIELDVFSSNGPAIALYRGLGFCEEGRRKRGRFVDGTYDDVLLMALDLKQPSQPPGAAADRRNVGPRHTMIMALRHLLAIAVLPFTVAVLVPLWIARRYGVEPTLGHSAGPALLQAVGLILLGLGSVLFVASVWRFATEGKGTLAPWDPPRVFVVRGPYQFVRNPMISGVILFLFGEASALLSPPHGAWAVGFLVLNLAYIPLVEEPQLERRFGGSYREYCRHVRRFIPRSRPWPPKP